MDFQSVRVFRDGLEIRPTISARGNEISDQFGRLGRPSLGHDHGPVNSLVRQQRGFNFTELDAETAYFYLVVNTPQKLQLARRRPATVVARLVQPPPASFQTDQV
jgi:hypothetical protein